MRTFWVTTSAARLGIAHTLSLVGLLVVLSSVAYAATDVTVNPLGGNEPTTAAVNPRSPNIIAVAQGLTVAISTDFGRTFPFSANMPQTAPNPPVYGTIATWNFCGDASVAFDSQGRLFMTYLLCGNDNTAVPPGPQRVDISSFVQQINMTPGPNFGTLTGMAAPVEVTGASQLHSDDKEWIAADTNPDSPFKDNLYVVWTRLDNNTSLVMFSRSTDGGVTWSAPATISLAAEAFAWPSHVAVAANGDLYVAYHSVSDYQSNTCGTAGNSQMFVLRDSNGGTQLAAGTAGGFQKSSFAAPITCNYQGGNPAFAVPGTDFWMQGAFQGFVIPDPLLTSNVYVVFNADPNSNYTTGDPGDVKLARSTDYGQSWAVTTASHGPAGTLQVYPTGAVDQLGDIVITWWDTRRGFRNVGNNFLLDQYASVSRDGGVTFTNDFRISDRPFDPDLNAACRYGSNNNCGTNDGSTPSTLRIGEYNGVAAANGTAYVIWTGNQTPPNPQATPPTLAAGNQTIYFDAFTMLGAFPDAMEPNDSWDPGVVSVLGADGTYHNADLTIHSDTDEDWFKVTALNTGELFFTIDYNSRFADLDIQVRDKFNNVIKTSTAGLDTNNTESIFIPAVASEAYFVRVFAEPGQVPPLNTYDLGIVNTPAPVPFGLTLTSGSSLTKNPTPTILLAVDLNPLSALSFSPDNGTPPLADDAAGYKVEVYRNGDAVGRATPVAGQPGIFAFTFTTPLTEGFNFITARVVVVDNSNNVAAGTLHAVGQGGESGALVVTLDTTAPGAGALGLLDLLASSDSGGVDDDNITTFSTPSFSIQVNEPGLVRIFAASLPGGAPIQVAQFQATTTGVWQVTVQSLSDGVYDMTATIEDAAGNVGPQTAALQVTIAKFSLTLPGLTVNPAGGAVTVDLAARTIQGFASASATSLIGINGIPTVNVNVNGNVLTVNLTNGDDTLSYTPSGPNAGSLALAGVNQTLNVSGSGTFTVKPLDGNDTVTTYGTAAGDTVNVTVKPTIAVQVGSSLTLNMPAAQIEKVGVSTLLGNDAINVSIFDTATASLFVDGGGPTTVNKGNDVLNLIDQSVGKKGTYSNISGGSTPGAGAVVLTFKAAGTSTRVDYVNIEKQTRK